MKEKIEEISLSMERGHRRVLRVLGVLLAIGLFVLLWKWRGPAALEPLIDGGMRRWTRAVLESIVITLAAQWVLCLLPWPLLALFGRTAPFCSVFSLRPCVGSKAELSRAAMIAVRLLPPVLVGAALWFTLARVPLVWFWPVAMASAGCLSAALGMVYDVVRVLQVPGRATFCDLGIVIQVYREVS